MKEPRTKAPEAKAVGHEEHPTAPGAVDPLRGAPRGWCSRGWGRGRRQRTPSASSSSSAGPLARAETATPRLRACPPRALRSRREDEGDAAQDEGVCAEDVAGSGEDPHVLAKGAGVLREGEGLVGEDAGVLRVGVGVLAEDEASFLEDEGVLAEDEASSFQDEGGLGGDEDGFPEGAIGTAEDGFALTSQVTEEQARAVDGPERVEPRIGGSRAERARDAEPVGEVLAQWSFRGFSQTTSSPSFRGGKRRFSDSWSAALSMSPVTTSLMRPTLRPRPRCCRSRLARRDLRA